MPRPMQGMMRRLCEDFAVKEAECLGWISTVLGESFEGANFAQVLKDGQVLCRVMNKLSPGSVHKIHTTGPGFKMMENIGSFTKAACAYGVPNTDLFQTVDLFEAKDIGQVIDTLYAVGRATYKHPEWPGPFLGPKPADECKREWTEEQLRASEGIVGLQAGSNKGASQAGMNIGKPRSVIQGK